MAKTLAGGPSYRIILLILCASAVLWVLAQWIADGDFRSVIIGGMVFAAVAVALSVFRNWRSGFYLFLVWLLFEDLARKYMGNGTMFFFGKDVLLTIIVFSFLLEQKRNPVKLFRPPFLWSLSIFMLLAMAQVFNPNSPSIVYGLLGMKMDFFYVPLVFLGYALLRQQADLDRFLLINMLLAVVIGGLGIAQAIIGPEFLNPVNLAPELNLAKLERASPITHLTMLRPCSVFVSTGRLSLYLVSSFILGLGATFYLFLRDNRYWRPLLAALSVVSVAAFMTGSRGCVMWLALSAIVLSTVTMWGTVGFSKGIAIRRIIRRSLIILAAGLSLAAWMFPDRVKAYSAEYSETLDPRSSESALFYRLWDYPAGFLTDALSQPNWLVGNGTGTAGLGMQYVSKLTGTRAPSVVAESGLANLILELGIIAPLFWLWWTGSAAWSCLKTAFKTKGFAAFPLAFALFWYAFYLLVLSTWGGLLAYQDFVSNAYLWLFIGILFRLPTLTPCVPK
jgi:hypothetical protein